MKRLINYLSALALIALVFTSCEDVPSPFGEIVKPDNGGGEVIEPSGDGTEANPYNVAGVLEFISGLGADTQSTKEVYVKGVIKEVTEKFGTQYGNATFIMTDTQTSTNKFTFYRGLYFGNEKYAKDTDTNVKEGDVVVICGKVVNYKGNTPETVQGAAYVVSINGEGGNVTPPTPTETLGTKDAPLSIDQALELINALGDGKESDKNAYVKGKVVKVTTNQTNFEKYGNLNYLISEDGTDNGKTITVYSGDGLDGAKFTAITDLAQGDEVIVFGKLYKFVNSSTGVVTPEIAKGNYLVSLVKGSGGGGGGQGGASGSGTKTDPFNVQAIIDYVSGLAADTDTKKEYYVKGIVTEIPNNGISTQYNNLTFYISDDTAGSNKFYVFRAKGLDGGDVTENMIKVGDEVVVFCDTWVNYKGNTPETKQGQAYIVSIKSGGGGGSSQGGTSGSGTETDPFNVQTIIDYVSGLAADTDTEKECYVKGIVTEIPNNGISTLYNNLTFYISDDRAGSNKFYVFRAKGLNGGDVTANMIKVGDEVVFFCDTWVNYKGNTPETKQGKAYIVSIKTSN